MNQTFDSWTDYDNWLIKNYQDFSIYKVNEVEGGKIEIEYKNKLSAEEAEKEAQAAESEKK